MALVVITLLLTAPLASLASARVEARAGDTVAIAGDDDCDVETSDAGTNDTGTNDVEEDILGMEGENGNAQTQYEDAGNVDQTQNGDLALNSDQLLQVEGGDSGVQEAQYADDEVEDANNDVQQVQDGDDDGDTVVARAGDTVAVASEDCDAETSVNTENVETEGDADDVAIENDEEIPDSTGQMDGDTVDTSDMSAVPPGDIFDVSSTGEDTTQENQLGLSGDPDTNGSAGQFRLEESGLGREQLKALLLSDGDWSLPRKGELDRIGKPRRFDRKPGAAMTLSIRALNLYDVPVTNSSTEKAFDRGVIHVPDTADPWDKETQKNVFLAGHRLGDPGEEDSRLVFYHLDELKPKDEIVLKDRKGRSYKYRVKELFKVKPDDAWVADTLVGRDLLTLTTYSLPNLEDRVVVRADRVQQDPERQQNPDRLQQNPVRQSDNSVRQQDSNRQQDSVRRQGTERKQDSGRPNPDRKKKRR